MNILSIGNSFSQDAQRYLHQIAKADGVELNTFNLYIGGCSLATHYRNMLTGERAYTLEMNGQSTGFKVSLQEGLLNRDWDVITLQQASRLSPDYDSYQPYLNELAACVRRCCPKGKLAIHQTWGYQPDSPMLTATMGYTTHEDMFEDVKAACARAAADIGADFILPSGEVVRALNAAGAPSIYRDTDNYHMNPGLGRYAIGLVWYAVLTGNSVTGNTFSALDRELSPERMDLAKTCAQRAADLFKNLVYPKYNHP